MPVASSKRIFPKKYKKRGNSHKDRTTVGEYLLKRLLHFHVDQLFSTHTTAFSFVADNKSRAEIHYSDMACDIAAGFAKKNEVGCFITTKEALFSQSHRLFLSLKEHVPLVVVNISREH